MEQKHLAHSSQQHCFGIERRCARSRGLLQKNRLSKKCKHIANYPVALPYQSQPHRELPSPLPGGSATWYANTGGSGHPVLGIPVRGPISCTTPTARARGSRWGHKRSAQPRLRVLARPQLLARVFVTVFTAGNIEFRGLLLAAGE
jgi:hypothetical protein